MSPSQIAALPSYRERSPMCPNKEEINRPASVEPATLVLLSLFVWEAIIDGPKVTEAALAGRNIAGYLSTHILFDSVLEDHKYNRAE